MLHEPYRGRVRRHRHIRTSSPEQGRPCHNLTGRDTSRQGRGAFNCQSTGPAACRASMPGHTSGGRPIRHLAIYRHLPVGRSKCARGNPRPWYSLAGRHANNHGVAHRRRPVAAATGCTPTDTSRGPTPANVGTTHHGAGDTITSYGQRWMPPHTTPSNPQPRQNSTSRHNWRTWRVLSR